MRFAGYRNALIWTVGKRQVTGMKAKKKVKNAARQVGLPPGTLLEKGAVRSEPVKVWVREYNGDSFSEQQREAASFDGQLSVRKDAVTWIHVTGVHSTAVVEKLGRCFGLHPLVMEDIVGANHRAKLEDYEEHVFLVAQAVYHTEDGEYTSEQISIILGENYVVSFQESCHDLFAPVLARIKSGKGRICRLGADYLAYALIDTVVDYYFVMIEDLGEQIEQMEEQLVLEPERSMVSSIYALKNELLFMRKAVRPLREVLNSLERGDSRFFSDATLLYLRDVYDHIIQVLDTLETYREMVTGMLDIYLSSVSHKLNEIMKVLTIISTIFIPLTFLAGVYGMNFKYMPELEWRWGYPFIWAVMIVAALIMVRYFRRKQWM